MSAAISDRTLKHLSQSLPLVESHRERLVARMQANLCVIQPQAEADGRPEIVAALLVDLLLTQARVLVFAGGLADLSDVESDHRAFEITGRHYSRFGDVLVPILKDLLGPGLPHEIASAWCDTFWAVIRAVQSRTTMAIA